MYSILDLVPCGHMPIYLQGKEEMCRCADVFMAAANFKFNSVRINRHLRNALTFADVYA